MKYVALSAPMLLCSEILSIVCLCAITVCIILDVVKMAKGGK